MTDSTYVDMERPIVHSFPGATTTDFTDLLADGAGVSGSGSFYPEIRMPRLSFPPPTTPAYAEVPSPEEAIEQKPGVCGGDPVLKGTRITVAFLWSLNKRRGWSVERICREYPSLGPTWIVAAIEFVEERPALQQAHIQQ
jgi:uncharacterized protein (DUF433 family)